MEACSLVATPAINAGTMPEYKAVPWLLTSVMVDEDEVRLHRP